MTKDYRKFLLPIYILLKTCIKNRESVNLFKTSFTKNFLTTASEIPRNLKSPPLKKNLMFPLICYFILFVTLLFKLSV